LTPNNYQEVVNYLFKKLPVFQRDGNVAFKKELNNILALCESLGNPQNKFKSIHVAGTNGKGSVSHILSAALQKQGYKTGLYTSPHLKDFRERIRINGIEVTEEFVIDFVREIESDMEEINPSFFEITVAMAFYYFKIEKVDVAIIETGLGGRLDSTNIITPLVSVITNIGLDHTEMLGETVEKIAFEKAGIIKENVPLVVGRANKEVMDVFEETCDRKNTYSVAAWNNQPDTEWETDLQGAYQQENIRTAFTTLKELKNSNIIVDESVFLESMKDVNGLTGFRGRWQILHESNPRIICDTGHNEDGLNWVRKSLEEESYEKLHIVFGVVKEKDLDMMLGKMPVGATYYFCRPNVLRGLDAEDLKKKAVSLNRIGESYGSVKDALEKAVENASANDLIFVGGSTFTVAEIV
jgi:dihydrofolate synthase/folylpolyglutamate synthase